MTANTSSGVETPHIPGNYGDLAEHWSWARLDDLCEGIYDCPHSTPKLAATGPYVARTQDVSSGVFLTKEAAHVSDETYTERTKRAIPSRGDLLYSREGTYFGIAAEIPRGIKVCLGQRMVLIRPDKDSIDFRFLRHWLNSPLMASYIHGFRDGSVAERLNLPTIRSLPVLVPPAFEQKAIADVLGAFDDKIAINERIVVTGEDLAITVASSKRWASIIPLGEIVRHVRDQVSPETFAIDRVAHYSLPAFDAGQMPELVSPTAIKSSKFLVNGPSVLLSKLNPSIPRVWSVDPSPDVPALASTEFLVLKPIDGISAHEIWAVSSQPDFINELTAKVTGTSNSHQRVKPTDLLNTRIVDPRAISDGIRGLISSIADRARRARRESLALTELRDTLLPRLMSGEIRVRDAEKVVKEVT